MRTILVLNPKGGCGKSTLATNLAGYYAREGRQVALADCDPQGSSSDWLKARPDHLPAIECAVAKDGTLRIPNKTEILVMDSPAALHNKKMLKMIGPAQTIIIPILPSPLDMRSAERFIAELAGMKSKIRGKKKIATVANRVREDTLAAAKLEYYLDKLKLPGGRHLPFMTVLRASQNYIHSAERGMSIFDLAPSRTYYDREQWQPLLDWLNSKRSIS